MAVAAALADPPELPRGRGDACVAPTDVMRREHMDFLLHQRDRTVHEGIRTARFSLSGCVDCHVQQNVDGSYIPVDAPEQFCDTCHRYASVKLDCFECHATTPSTGLSALAPGARDFAGILSFGGGPRPRPAGE